MSRNRADDYSTGLEAPADLYGRVDRWADAHGAEHNLDAEVTEPRGYGESLITFRDADTGLLVRQVEGLDEFDDYVQALDRSLAALDLPLAA